MPKRAGRKSLSQTPAPTKDRVIGSKINPKGSAMSKTSAKNIKFSAKTIDTLKNKLTEFKKKYPSKTNITISDLKAVYRRGSGAYSGSHRPTITGGAPNSRAAWSFARVNKFLEKAAGKKVKKAYVQDDDLLKYENGGLIAPNGKPSNLTPEQYKLVRTKAFKEWFGDWENDPANASKVVDENGEPMILYRGNLVNQEKLGYTFNLGENFLKKQSGNTFGFFFTNKIDIAKKYMLVDHFDEIRGGSLTEVFIKSNKILDLKDFDLKISQNSFVEGLIQKGIIFDNELEKRILDFDPYTYEYWGNNVFDYFDVFPELRNLFIKNGFTSVVFYEMSRNYSKYQVYVAFNSNQIKLADGTNTTFDGSNPDIRYAKGGKTKKSGGDCYFIAGSMAMDFGNKINYIGTPYVVHAEVKGQGAIADIRYGHAWIEDDENVYDFSNGRELVIPKQLYYLIGDIKTDNPKKYQKYTFAEARKKMVDTRHYGCWDIEVDYENGGTLNYKAMEDKMVALPDTYSNPKRLNEVLNAQGYGLVEKPFFKPHKTVYQIAEEQDVPIDIVKHQLVKGMDVESEHSDDFNVQQTIALQHLDEDVFYYQKLKMKNGGYFKSGGEVKPDDKGTKDMITHKSGEAGGMLVGNRHSEGGIKAINKSNGQPLEMEGGEVVITRNAVSDNTKHEFEGEMLTNRQILSRINESGGGVSFADGGDIPHKCSCSGKSYKFGGDTLKDSEIVGRINSRYDKSMEGIVYPELKDSERLEKLYVPNEQYEKAVNLYGEGGMVRLVHKKVPSYKAFANKHKEISQPMMKKSYKLYLQKNYGIDFNKLPHNLQVALLIGSQTLIDKYLNS